MARSSNDVIDAPDIRGLIWIYLSLLMFEGALRKWILPDLSDPLLLVRDPFLLLIYISALSRGIFPFNGYVIALFLIGILSAMFGMTAGSQNLLVTAYGFDSMFLHLPLLFIVPRVITRNDVIMMGRLVLWLTIPMAVLMVLQFRAPSEAWINRGAGGGAGAQIRSALGKIRPPGLFTFITGAAQFLALASAFLIFGLWKKGVYPQVLLLVAGFAITISTVVSSSRLALGGIGMVFLMVGVVVFYNPKSANNILRLLIPIGLILVVATNLDIFKEGREVFEARLDEAGDLGKGVSGTATNWTTRVFGDFTGAILACKTAPLIGSGLGVGTNVGARVLSGQLGFLLAEGEWARVVLEIGPFLAFPYLAIRCLLCGYLLFAAVSSARAGNALPMLLFGACALLLMTGQFSQTNTLGFAVLGSGLCLASTNVPVEGTAENLLIEAVLPKRGRRGRSPYAAALHAGSNQPQ
jgi:hypothetical protein